MSPPNTSPTLDGLFRRTLARQPDAIALEAQFVSPTGARVVTRSRADFVPQLFYAHGLKELPLAVGLGMYAPYGLPLEWPDNPVLGRCMAG